MPSITYDNAVETMLRILPNMDKGQREEVEYLVSNSTFIQDGIRNLLAVSDYFWSDKKNDFEFIVGAQTIGWSDYNVWLLSTCGIRDNLRFLIRNLKRAEQAFKWFLHNEPFSMYATMPKWFDDGHKLAAYFGFSISSTDARTVTFMRTFI